MLMFNVCIVLPGCVFCILILYNQPQSFLKILFSVFKMELGAGETQISAGSCQVGVCPTEWTAASLIPQ